MSISVIEEGTLCAPDTKENDITISRVDSLNWGILKAARVDENSKSQNAGKLVWREVGYYGSNLKMACTEALKQAPKGTHGAAEILKALESNTQCVLAAVGHIAAIVAQQTEAVAA